jgi:TetR/AcrR family transcriptional regulator, transcriptional repressor for nem operon
MSLLLDAISFSPTYLSIGSFSFHDAGVKSYLPIGRSKPKEARYMDIREAILDSAEKRMRKGGFHACSFREIANDVGIKSASVHYHFGTKVALGEALVTRYEAKVLEAIGDPEDARDLAAKLEAMRAAFRSGLRRGDGMCLGGVLATETRSLPSPVGTATRRYFSACNDWLARALACARIAEPRRKALQLTALLQGAMLQAIALVDLAAFDEATERLFDRPEGSAYPPLVIPPPSDA